MSWAQVCNSRMYRTAMLFALTAGWAMWGCQKPATEEATSLTAAPGEEEAARADDEAARGAAEPQAGEARTAAGATQPIVVQDVGFKTPESVYYNEGMDIYLVSNINGSPTEADNNGFISKVSPEGQVVALTWIAGGQNDATLNAPKGMAEKDGVLYVADIDAVRMFDLASGAPKGMVAIEGATFLNDVAVGSDGTIYVSDSGQRFENGAMVATGSDAVWTIKGETAAKLIGGPELNRPNGLLADEDGVWVVTLGGTELYKVTKAGEKQASVTVPGGALDGLARTGDGDLLISSWEAGAVFQRLPSGQFAPVLADITSPADIGYDSKRDRVLVPVFQDDAVLIHPLGSRTASLRADAPEPETAADKAETGQGAGEEARAGAERPDQEAVRSGSEKAESEKMGSEKAESEKMGSEKAESEKMGSEKAESEKTGAENRGAAGDNAERGEGAASSRTDKSKPSKSSEMKVQEASE